MEHTHSQLQNNASASDNNINASQQVNNLGARPANDNLVHRSNARAIDRTAGSQVRGNSGDTSDNGDAHGEDNMKGRSFFEMSWTKKYDFFLHHGYELRPRYSPEWEPSWKTNGKPPQQCEDYHRLPLRRDVIDATRTSDGALVYLKRVKTGSEELSVAAFFSQNPQKGAPDNHCVPILDTFEDPDEDVTYMVMPFLRYADDPPFEVVDDVIDMVTQLLEGLKFMHGNAAAHLGCAYRSIMMDGSSLYPKGFHPVLTDFTPDCNKEAKPYARFTAPKPVRYYFVDFGIARMCSRDENGNTLITGTDGPDATVPELSDTVAYDPYKVDVYVLGNFFKQYIYNRYSNIEILAPFVKKMTARDPSERPDSTTVKATWDAAIAGLTLIQRAQYLVERSDKKGKSGPFFLPFLAAGPILLIKGWFSNARWTQAVLKEAAKSDSEVRA